jgi:DNA-binding CsgD family transcriptional regulator
MVTFSNLCLFIAVICLFVGFYSFRINNKITLNRLFFIFCIWIAVLNILSVIAYSSKSKEEFVFWTHFVTFFTHTFFPLNLHFYITLFHKKKLGLLKLSMIYIPSLLLMIVPLINYKSYYDFTSFNGEWKWIPAVESPWLYLFLIFIIAYSVLTVLFVIIYGKKTKFNKEKKQTKLIIINFILTISVGITTVGILPSFYPKMQNIGLSYSLFYVLALFFAVFKYKFLNLKTTFIADEVISHISDILIMLDLDYKIVLYNKKFVDNFSLNPNDIKEKNIYELIEKNDDFRNKLEKLIKSRNNNFYYRLNYINGSDIISTDSYISKITDNFFDTSGFIIISKINKGKIIFQKLYKITEREFEVIDLILSGLSNEQIGYKLGISERTVESHCLHIYNKIGINDRMELFKICVEFDLILNKKI